MFPRVLSSPGGSVAAGGGRRRVSRSFLGPHVARSEPREHEEDALAAHNRFQKADESPTSGFLLEQQEIKRLLDQATAQVVAGPPAGSSVSSDVAQSQSEHNLVLQKYRNNLEQTGDGLLMGKGAYSSLPARSPSPVLPNSVQVDEKFNVLAVAGRGAYSPNSVHRIRVQVDGELERMRVQAGQNSGAQAKAGQNLGAQAEAGQNSRAQGSSSLGILILATIKDVMRCKEEASVLKENIKARRAQVSAAYFDTDRILQGLGAHLEALPAREESMRQQALKIVHSQAQSEVECQLWRKRAVEVSRSTYVCVCVIADNNTRRQQHAQKPTCPYCETIACAPARVIVCR